MFEQILGIDILTALLLPITWGIAGYLASRLTFRRTQGRLLVSVGITLAVLGLAGLLVVAKMVTIQQFWSYGWLFAQDRLIMNLPLVILPAAATLVWSVPRLWRIARPLEKRRPPLVSSSLSSQRRSAQPSLHTARFPLRDKRAYRGGVVLLDADRVAHALGV
jgi:hypothetical protein